MLDKEQRVLMKDSTVLNESFTSRSLCFQLRCGGMERGGNAK